MATDDAVLRYMKENHIKMTRRNYLNIAYFGNPPKRLSAEEAMDLPEPFQLKRYRAEEC